MTPTPGSPEAIEAGCTCPVMDNRRGEGVMLLGVGPFFWSNGDCPLHDKWPVHAGEEEG